MQGSVFQVATSATCRPWGIQGAAIAAAKISANSANHILPCPVEKLRRQEDHQVMGDGSQVHFAAAGLILS